MKEIIIPRNKAFYWRIALILPLPIAWLLYSAWEYIVKNTTTGYGWIVFVLLLLMVLLPVFINSVLKLSDKNPALKITKEGIDDRVSMAGAGFIKWDNIIKSELKDYTGSKRIVIHLIEYTEIVNRLSYFKRNMVKQMVADLGAPIVIDTKMIKHKAKDLNALINRRARGKKRR